MIREDAKFKSLVQQVFRSEPGAQLLEELAKLYCLNNFDENPYAMARKCGESDLVMFLRSVMDEQ